MVDVSLVDSAAELGGSVEICLRSNQRNLRAEELCLAFIDESLSPPEWVCEDETLSEASPLVFCGTTDHFTNFALLLAGGGARGSSSSTDYVTNSMLGDILLILGLLLLCCFIFVILALLTTFVRPITTFVYGEEGYRIKTARTARKSSVFDS